MTGSQQNTISKASSQGPHINYKGMIKEGIQWIQKTGHKNWTNYNSSDPGRTILDMMSYALLDQGYKCEFPIADLLSNKKNKIDLKDQMYEAEEILYSNPVTLKDYRKLLIDRAENIKNVWVEPHKVKNGIKGLLFTWYELNDPLKVLYLKYQNQTSTNAEYEAFKDQLDALKSGLYGVLCKCRNLGDFILHPILLRPVPFSLSGEIYLNSSTEPEYGIAKLFYNLNNLVSSYIHFKTYEELKARGLTTDDIMSGPRLENGFIEDSDLKPRPTMLSKDKCRSAILSDSTVGSIKSFDINPTANELANTSIIQIGFGTLPFFDYSKIATKIHPEKDLKLYQGERRVMRLDQAKINAHYAKLTERKPVSSYNFKNQLGPVIPKGHYRNLSTFHSIQKLFPQRFGLDVDRSYTGIPKSKRGPAKQLKAYLMLFEQILADHQAQLEHFPRLLSFDSGVSTGKPICRIHYAKALYETPGSRFILKAFDNYKRLNEYVNEHPDIIWEAFKNDPNNSYSNFINTYQNKLKDGIRNKSDVLCHLLARHGEKYLDKTAIELNPNYGDYDLARVEVISSLLKNFTTYSGNMGRSYFSAHPGQQFLFTGLEERLGLLFQLNDYYEGIEELMSSRLEDPDSKLEISKDQTNHHVEVSYRGELILDIPCTETQDSCIKKNMGILSLLRDQTKGFVLIDNQLIINNLQDEEWLIMLKGAVKAFKSKSLKNRDSFSVLTAHRLLAKIAENKDIDGLALGIRTRNKTGERHHHAITTHPLFQGNVSVFLPGWLPKLKQPSFLKSFKDQIQSEGPAHLNYQVHYLTEDKMKELLSLRSSWLEGFNNLCKGDPFGLEPSVSNLLLLDFMLDLNASEI